METKKELTRDDIINFGWETIGKVVDENNIIWEGFRIRINEFKPYTNKALHFNEKDKEIKLFEIGKGKPKEVINKLSKEEFEMIMVTHFIKPIYANYKYTKYIEDYLIKTKRINN